LLRRDIMDALELLKEDHQKVKELFEEAEATENEKDKRKIFDQISAELELTLGSRKRFFIPLWRSTIS
jgi:hypothetical protein